MTNFINDNSDRDEPTKKQKAGIKKSPKQYDLVDFFQKAGVTTEDTLPKTNPDTSLDGLKL